MKVTHKLIDGTNDKLILFVLTNGEFVIKDFTDVEASVIHCHIDFDGHDITKEELFNEKNVNQLMQIFLGIIKHYETTFPTAKKVVMGYRENAEVALDLLIKENELIEGAILVKPILNIALTDGIMIEDYTKVLIIEGTREGEDQRIEEQEVADILSVNGYEVDVVEVEEGDELSDMDVEASKNWLREKFS